MAARRLLVILICKFHLFTTFKTAIFFLAPSIQIIFVKSIDKLRQLVLTLNKAGNYKVKLKCLIFVLNLSSFNLKNIYKLLQESLPSKHIFDRFHLQDSNKRSVFGLCSCSFINKRAK